MKRGENNLDFSLKFVKFDRFKGKVGRLPDRRPEKSTRQVQASWYAGRRDVRRRFPMRHAISWLQDVHISRGIYVYMYMSLSFLVEQSTFKETWNLWKFWFRDGKIFILDERTRYCIYLFSYNYFIVFILIYFNVSLKLYSRVF